MGILQQKQASNDLFSVEDCQKLNIKEVHELYRRHVNATRVDLLSSFQFGRELADRAEGIFIYSKSGKKIYDFTGGIGVLNHGHNHPRILKVRKDFQNNKRMEVHRNYFSQYIAAIGHNLARLLPGDLNYSFFPNSGSEAVDGAMKVAFKYHKGKRDLILYSDIAFHGKLFGSASVTNSPENNFSYPEVPVGRMYRYNDLNSVTKLIESTRKSDGETNIAGILIEPFNASNMLESKENFLVGIRELCDKNDIVLIFDEVYSGWCKTGPLFNFMRVKDLIPDVLLTAKSFGGGKSSIAGMITRERIFHRAFDNVSSANLQTTTFYSFGEETVTALEAINIVVDEDFSGKSVKIEKTLTKGFARLREKYPQTIRDIRGAGSIHGIFFRQAPKLISVLINLLPGELCKDQRFLQKLVTASVISELYNRHNLLTFMGLGFDIHLIVSPPMIAKSEDLHYFIDSMDNVLEDGLLSLVTHFVKNKITP